MKKEMKLIMILKRMSNRTTFFLFFKKKSVFNKNNKNWQLGRSEGLVKTGVWLKSEGEKTCKTWIYVNEQV